MTTTALIDADIVAYRAAASAENEPEEIAIVRADKTMREILESTGCGFYRGFLSGQTNFRKILYPAYKANRTQPRPIHLAACQQFLVEEWDCDVTDGYEADDALGMEQDENTILCSIDKDFRQIPGHHYEWEITGTSHGKSWVKPQSFYTVNELDGTRFFWRQMMIGDVADNIIGVNKIGEKKAAGFIDHLNDPSDMFDVVLEKYEGDLSRFLINGVCLYVWQRKEQLWPNLLLNHYRLNEASRRAVEVMLNSMKSLTGVISTEPITTTQQISGFPVNGPLMDDTPTENAA